MNGAAFCRCGHIAWVHAHYRPGTGCALCDCPRFHKAAK